MKKLYRSERDKMIAGVCGGIADYYNVDANIVRLLTVVLSLFTGAGVVAYIVAAAILPKETDLY